MLILSFVLPFSDDGPLLHVTERQTFYCKHPAARDLEIMCVNRQIYNEASDVLLWKNQVAVFIDKHSSMRKCADKAEMSPTLFSGIPSVWNTSFRNRIRRIRRLCITVELKEDPRIAQEAIAEILEVLHFGNGLVELELAGTDAVNAATDSTHGCLGYATLKGFLRQAYPGSKWSTIKMTNVPPQFEHQLVQYIWNND